MLLIAAKNLTVFIVKIILVVMDGWVHTTIKASRLTTWVGTLDGAAVARLQCGGAGVVPVGARADLWNCGRRKKAFNVQM